MSRLDRWTVILLLLLVIGIQTYGTLQQANVLSHSSFVKNVIERMQQMAHFQESWQSGGLTYTVTVDQIPGQTPQEAEAIFEERLASQLRKHPRDP